MVSRKVQDLFYKGMAFLELRSIRWAVEHLQKAIKADPDHVPSLYALGRAQYKVGDLDQAIECFR